MNYIDVLGMRRARETRTRRRFKGFTDPVFTRIPTDDDYDWDCISVREILDNDGCCEKIEVTWLGIALLEFEYYAIYEEWEETRSWFYRIFNRQVGVFAGITIGGLWGVPGGMVATSAAMLSAEGANIQTHDSGWQRSSGITELIDRTNVRTGSQAASKDKTTYESCDFVCY